MGGWVGGPQDYRDTPSPLHLQRDLGLSISEKVLGSTLLSAQAGLVSPVVMMCQLGSLWSYFTQAEAPCHTCHAFPGLAPVTTPLQRLVCEEIAPEIANINNGDKM